MCYIINSWKYHQVQSMYLRNSNVLSDRQESVPLYHLAPQGLNEQLPLICQIAQITTAIINAFESARELSV